MKYLSDIYIFMEHLHFNGLAMLAAIVDWGNLVITELLHLHKKVKKYINVEKRSTNKYTNNCILLRTDDVSCSAVRIYPITGDIYAYILFVW